MEIVAAPKLDLIKFTNQAYNKDTHQYKDVSSVTYTLNPDKTQYVATLVTINGQTFTGNAITRDLLCQVKSSAVLSFDVDQVQTSWMPASDQWAQGKDRVPTLMLLTLLLVLVHHLLTHNMVILTVINALNHQNN